MAILSDSSLLLSHIKRAFIFGDESGLCESIIENESIIDYDLEMVLNNKFKIDIIDTTTSQFRSHSPEISIYNKKPQFNRKITSDLRIKEVEDEKALISDNHKFLDTGQWPKNLNEHEINDFFGQVNDKVDTSFKVKSLLSKMLAETHIDDTMSMNIFASYAKCSAISYSKFVDHNTKRVHIKAHAIPDSDPNNTLKDFNVYFCDYSNQKDRLNPIVIRPLMDTRVSDFIGLACWKYTDENRDPPLCDKNMVNKLQLYMFEDNDDLDIDFGCLHREDPIYKYQFTNLAVLECMASGRRKMSTSSIMTLDSSFVTQSHIERLGIDTYPISEGDVLNDHNSRNNSFDLQDDSILVQVQLAHGVSNFRFPPCTTMEQIVQKTMIKRHLQEHGNGYKYRLELASEPGKEISIDKTLAEIEDPTFILIRDMSRRKPAIPDSISEESSELLLNLIDCLQPQNYMVFLKKTLRRSEANLIVSGEVIQIDVLANKVPFLIKPKRVRIPISFMVDCTLDTHGQLEADNLDRKCTLKLVHLKRKSTLVKVLKISREYDENGPDSESSSGKSHGRNEVSSSMMNVNVNNLLSELTSHSVSCQWYKAKQIYDQVMSILNLRSSVIRREYLKLK